MNPGRRAAAFLTSVLFLLSACVSPRILPTEYSENPGKLIERVKPGDVIFVTDESGERHRIKVESNDGKSIKGDGMQFDLAHVAKIETQQFDPVRTGVAVAICAAVAFEVIVLIEYFITGPAI